MIHMNCWKNINIIFQLSRLIIVFFYEFQLSSHHQPAIIGGPLITERPFTSSGVTCGVLSMYGLLSYYKCYRHSAGAVL